MDDPTMMGARILAATIVAWTVCLAACTGGENAGGGGAMTKGAGPYNCFTDAPANATVQIEVFTSPTRAATDDNPAETVRKHAEAFAGKVKCTLRPVSPFEQLDALTAGRAILAAAEQGRAWDMYVYLKDHLEELGGSFEKNATRELGLDAARFEKDLARDDFVNEVKTNTQKTSQGHPRRRVQLDGEWDPCGSPSLDCLGDKIKAKLSA